MYYVVVYGQISNLDPLALELLRSTSETSFCELKGSSNLKNSLKVRSAYEK